jgi:ABC-type multidrug transport system fused ATPase/permease subunit
VAEFQSVYEENETKAQKQFTEKIQGAISAEMINIEWHSEYEFLEQVRALLKPYAMKWANSNNSSVHAENEVVNVIGDQLQKDGEKMALLKKKLKNYFEEIKKSKLSADFLAVKPTILGLLFKTIGVVIGGPFWVLAKILNALPEYIIEKKIIAPIKDLTWHISLRTGASMFVYPIYYLIVFVILGISTNWLLAGIIVSTFPILSTILYETEYHFRKLSDSFILFQKPEILKREQQLVKEFKSLLS